MPILLLRKRKLRHSLGRPSRSDFVQLKVREYDDIKNYIKGKGHLFGFNRKEYKYMEMFQKYRNCVLHSSYHFSVDEKKDIEKEIIYTLIHVLGILMSAEITEDRIFMQEYLNENEYTKLLENSFYIKELEDFLRKEYDEVYICPDCLKRTLTPDFKCARCFNVFSDFHFYGYAECGSAGKVWLFLMLLTLSVIIII
ncbi:MAG: hypothetical protein ACLT1J_09815 [Mediterraneibacter gnavus]